MAKVPLPRLLLSMETTAHSMLLLSVSGVVIKSVSLRRKQEKNEDYNSVQHVVHGMPNRFIVYIGVNMCISVGRHQGMLSNHTGRQRQER